MLRKIALGLVAAGSLALASFAPTTDASAHDNGPRFRGHHHGFGVHRGWHGARAHFRHHGCIQHRLVKTRWGVRYRPINVCR
jgi:hypothetical protein